MCSDVVDWMAFVLNSYSKIHIVIPASRKVQIRRFSLLLELNCQHIQMNWCHLRMLWAMMNMDRKWWWPCNRLLSTTINNVCALLCYYSYNSKCDAQNSLNSFSIFTLVKLIVLTWYRKHFCSIIVHFFAALQLSA